MFENVAALSKQMCSQLFGRYGLALPDGPAVPSPGSDALPVPDVVVFDADSSCGADLALRLGRPGVARVGTGVRDIFTTPLTHPIPMSGTSLFAYEPNHLVTFSRSSLRLVRMIGAFNL